MKKVDRTPESMPEFQSPIVRSRSSRPFQGEADLLDMLEFLSQARSRCGDWRYPHLGELLFSYFMVQCHLSPQEHIRLWRFGNGDLAAYAMLGEDPAFDFQVFPDFEWAGIEDEALSWAEGLVDHLRQQEPERWSAGLVCGARQDDAARIGFLEHNGFRFSDEFAEYNLLRSLDEALPDAPVASGFEVRNLTGAGEIPGRAAVHRQVWQPWTVGNVSSADYTRFMQLPGYRQDLDLVAVTAEGEIAAYANGWLDSLNRIGDFGPVGALPAYRRRGLTRAVLVEGLRRMRRCGMERACISTTVSNTPALRLYESIGFKVVNRYLDYVKPAG